MSDTHRLQIMTRICHKFTRSLSMAFYAYMLECSDRSIYTGQCDNLEARLAAHQDGRFRGYTFKRRPVRLIFHESFSTREEALSAEREIKGWTRGKKWALA